MWKLNIYNNNILSKYNAKKYHYNFTFRLIYIMHDDELLMKMALVLTVDVIPYN